MLAAGRKANELGHPAVLDPVGAGASALRTNTALELLRQVRFAVVRGNMSEVRTLARGSGTTKGVDVDAADRVTEQTLPAAVSFARAFAKNTGCVAAITGAIDIVTDGERAFCIRNGHPMMSAVTGTGCQLSALTAAFAAANPGHTLEAAAAAVCAMFTGHLLSGVLFFSDYAWKGWGAWGYSLAYNLSQNVPLCLLPGVIVLLMPLGAMPVASKELAESTVKPVPAISPV